MSALIEFALWLLRKNNKDAISSKFLTPILDELIAKEKYPEGWAVLGRYLPWIMLINKEWVKKNLDKIFPKKDRARFDAAWLTYINYVPSFDEAFEVLRDQYLYVLSNSLYWKENAKRTYFKLGESLASFYARGKVSLNDKDEILVKLFEEKNSKEGEAMMSLIAADIS